jgi:hypothetical protein
MQNANTAAMSVIVPALNAEAVLSRCLAALRRDAEAGEILLVDDGSTDRTAQIAESAGVQVLRLPRSAGPGPARNHGARHARGAILMFVDADVAVADGALRRAREFLGRHPEFAAVFGSYDDQPAAAPWLSQYRNLLHHYVHQHAGPEASHFWAGLGAVRREAFLAVGGFDEGRYARVVEDVELGYRLRAGGFRIKVDRDLLCTHLRKWTLASMLRVDFAVRGVPWTRLLLERRMMPRDFSLGWRQRVSVTLASLALAGLALGPLGACCAAVALGAAAGFVLINGGFFAFLTRRRGPWFAAACLPLHLLYHLVSGAALASGAASYALGSLARRGGPAPQRGGAR